MRHKQDYLVKLNSKIKKVIAKDDSFSATYNLLLKGKIKLSESINEDSLREEINKIKDLINVVISIIYKPLINNEFKESILRSEVSGPLSSNSFIETTKDSKLWKQKGSTMSPEYVHSLECEDTLDIYENRFICLFIKFIKDRVNTLFNMQIVKAPSIENRFETTITNYSSHGIFSEFKEFSYPYANLCTKNKKSGSQNYKDILDIIKKIKRIEQTSFFQLLKDKNIDPNIMATSILLHNPLYFSCYHYYKANKIKLSSNENFDTYYYNYVLLNLFLFLAKNDCGKTTKSNNAKLSIDSRGRLRFSEISFKKGVFSFFIKEDSINYGINIETHFINNAIRSDTHVSNRETAKYYIKIMYKYDDIDKKEFHSNFKNKAIDNNANIVITMNNNTHDYDKVIKLSYLLSGNDLLIKNLITSFSMLFVVDDVLFSNRCPICGSTLISNDDGCCTCLECNGSYSFINANKKNLLWIKSFRREK